MQISYFEDEKKVVVKIVGELDESASNVAKQELDYILNSTNKKALLFDMARMSFMDSTGIGVADDALLMLLIPLFFIFGGSI